MARTNLARQAPEPDATVAIIFGANPPTRQVLMQFEQDGTRFVFSSEAAKDIAAKLLHYADVADGRKVM